MKKEKVIIGLSGGVDSAVAAYLLKKEGFLIEGLFMRNWDSYLNHDIKGNPNFDNDICPQEEDYNDALKVADTLGIKLHRVDFVKEYYDDVFSYFLKEMEKGRTPNPDVMCNKYIKFGSFLKKAKELGADYIATGHYAKMEDGFLKMPKDKNKDQTYFLCMLSSEKLSKVKFPLENLTKDEVREIARKLNLSVSEKKDSTGICFIGERQFSRFLDNYLKEKEGKIVDISTGNVIGHHKSIYHYTIGQRRGLDVGGTSKRMFVVGKDITTSTIYVAIGSDNKYLYSNSAVIDGVTFNSNLRPRKAKAKLRYRAPLIDINIEYLSDKKIKITYEDYKAVTPGQICALYSGDICFGGGFIDLVYKDDELLTYLYPSKMK